MFIGINNNVDNNSVDWDYKYKDAPISYKKLKKTRRSGRKDIGNQYSWKQQGQDGVQLEE